MKGMIELNNSLQTQFARAQPFLPSQFLGFLMILKFLFEEYLCWFTRPAEVFLHRRFGVRGHGSFQALQICAVGILAASGGANQDLPLTLFCLASAALAVYHRFETVRAEMRGVVRFSWSNGEPIPIWGWASRLFHGFGMDPNRFVNASLICRFYEPVLVLAIGLSLRPASVALSAYLVGCSVALFLKNLIIHSRLLNMKRDQIDARIFSAWLASIHRTAAGQAEERYFLVQLTETPARRPDNDNEGETATMPEQQPETAIIHGNLLRVNCENCKTEFRVHRKHDGKKGRCRKCGEIVLVAAAVS